MIKVVKIFCAAVLVGVLAACGGVVNFKNVKLSESDTVRTISGILAKPEGEGPFPGVVLLHTGGGLKGPVVEDWPEYLTALGYVTLSVDNFGPRGIAYCPTPLCRNHRELSKDAYGALDFLASLPFVDKERVGVMGFSLGGNTINFFAGRGFKSSSGLDFKAAISFYGRCHRLLRYSETIPTTVIIGELENERRLSPCKALAEESSPSIKVYLLPDTYHAFDNSELTTLENDSNGNPMLYSQEATKKAREITKAFLAEHLGKR